MYLNAPLDDIYAIGRHFWTLSLWPTNTYSYLNWHTNTLMFTDLKARLPSSFLRHFNGWEGFWVATLIFRVPLQGWATPLATWNFSTWGREEWRANGPRWLHLSTSWLNWCSSRNTHQTWENTTMSMSELHLQWSFLKLYAEYFFLIECKNIDVCTVSTA